MPIESLFEIKTKLDFDRVVAMLMLAYLLLAYAITVWRHRSVHNPDKERMSLVSNAAKFAVSIMVLWAVVSPSVMSILGDTHIILLT